MNREEMDELLGRNKYLIDDQEKHIRIDSRICAACPAKPCIPACPAGLYRLQAGIVGLDLAGCLECGTCRIVCPYPTAIEWNYPRGGYGISYRYG